MKPQAPASMSICKQKETSSLNLCCLLCHTCQQKATSEHNPGAINAFLDVEFPTRK